MRSIEEALPTLKRNVSGLESKRLALWKTRKSGMLWVAIALAVGAAGVVTGLALGAPLFIVGLLGVTALIAIGLIAHFAISLPAKSYRTIFKSQFIEPLISSVAEQVRYEPEGQLDMLDQYRASELFTSTIDRYHIEDTIYGKVGETDLMLSEMHTEYKTTSTDSKGQTTTHWHTIFKGIFISADFHKEFRGSTFVRADVAEKTFGVMGRLLQKPVFSSLQLVQLEDPDFEREFVVKASNQVEARFILSTSMMQRMVELKKKFACHVEFSFLHSRMFIAIPTKKNFFEPKLSENLLAPGLLERYLEEIRLLLGVTEDLGLNVRVWGKQ